METATAKDVKTARLESPYVQLVGCVGGVAGSLIGYTLTQSLLLALIGGLAGILAGLGVSKAVLWMRSR
jgi:hypothetical protein